MRDFFKDSPGRFVRRVWRVSCGYLWRNPWRNFFRISWRYLWKHFRNFCRIFEEIFKEFYKTLHFFFWKPLKEFPEDFLKTPVLSMSKSEEVLLSESLEKYLNKSQGNLWRSPRRHFIWICWRVPRQINENVLSKFLEQSFCNILERFSENILGAFCGCIYGEVSVGEPGETPG